METTAVLLAIEEIKALKSRYFSHIDLKEWDSYRDLFTPDMEALGPDGAVAMRGGAEFAASVRAFLDPSLSIHQGYLPRIEVLSPDTARGIWAMHDIITWADGDPRQGNRRMEGWGHYHETYRRLADGWRISSLRLTRIKVDTSR